MIAGFQRMEYDYQCLKATFESRYRREQAGPSSSATGGVNHAGPIPGAEPQPGPIADEENEAEGYAYGIDRDDGYEGEQESDPEDRENGMEE